LSHETNSFLYEWKFNYEQKLFISVESEISKIMKILLLYAGADLQQKNGSGEYGKECSDPPLVIRCLELCSIKRMFKLRQKGTKFFKSYYLRSRLPAHLKKNCETLFEIHCGLRKFIRKSDWLLIEESPCSIFNVTYSLVRVIILLRSQLTVTHFWTFWYI
jgi:hypothetical protein